MNHPNLLPVSSVKHEIDERGVCRLQIMGRLAPEAVAAIARCVRVQILQDQSPEGIILDMRDLPLLSAVRLASLLDVLSNLGLRLAVLVSDERQRQIIVLLHNTLEHKELIDYFTDLPTARAFVLSGPVTPAAPPTLLSPAVDHPL